MVISVGILRPQGSWVRTARLGLLGCQLTGGILLTAFEPVWAAPRANGVEEVIVTGERSQAADRPGQTGSILDEQALVKQAASTLGETLAKQPGVHNASFGPGVGLPVLRGLSGVRVRVMEDGIGSWDASAMSPDHANAVEAFAAKSIEVLQGAAAIEHGGAAIGGLVAVNTRRLPKPDGDTGQQASLAARQELVNHHQQQALMGQVDWRSEQFGLHLDGLQRRQNSLGIPGCAIDTQAVEAQFGFDASAANSCGQTANTDGDSTSLAGGLGFNRGPFYWAVSHRVLDNQYGLPPGGHSDPPDGGAHPAHNHGGAGDGGGDFVRLVMQQTRHDAIAGVVMDEGWLQSLDLAIAQVDYQHEEIEHQQVATRFDNQVQEATLKMPHQWSELWQGSAGLHRVERTFAATGSENFVPPTDSLMQAAFSVQRLAMGGGDYELGARWENTRIEQLAPTAPLGLSRVQLMHQPIEYTTGSAQLAARYFVAQDHRLGVSLGHNQRAPDIQELLALGPHLATRSYDIGLLIRPEPGGFKVPQAETFNNLELTWQWASPLGNQQLSLFRYGAQDFIYQRNLGLFYDLAEQLLRNNCVRLEECLPVYEFTQADARFSGGEWQWSLPQWHTTAGAWQLTLLGDKVTGALASGEALPRMPPWRLSINLQWQRGDWQADLHGTRLGAQRRPGEFETPSRGARQWDASLQYRLQAPGFGLTAFLQGKNLTDAHLRSATSFMRNFTPEAGRQLELGLRWDY